MDVTQSGQYQISIVNIERTFTLSSVRSNYLQGVHEQEGHEVVNDIDLPEGIEPSSSSGKNFKCTRRLSRGHGSLKIFWIRVFAGSQTKDNIKKNLY